MFFTLALLLPGAVVAAGPIAYVPNNVSVIDTDTNRKLRDIAVGEAPWGVVIR